MSNTYRLAVGDRVWIDGSVVRIVEISDSRSIVESDRGTRAVSTPHLVRSSQPLDAPRRPCETSGQLLSNLTKKQQETYNARLAVVEAVLEMHHNSGDSIGRSSETVALAHNMSDRTVKRWVKAYQESGPAGLVEARKQRSPIDPLWREACLDVLNRYTRESTPSRNIVIDQANNLLTERCGADLAPTPSNATAYRWLDELSKGRYSFGSGKARRIAADRPEAPYGRLRATRPGEYFVLDTTRLDVFAMEPITLRWVPVELTVAQDLYTRCIVGLRLTPISTKAIDVANVLHQSVTPQEPVDDGAWPFHGVPSSIAIERDDPTADDATPSIPGCLPESIVVDHGKIYLSHHVRSACARLGISIQPAIVKKASDKPTVERFFKTIRLGLLQQLPGYKGPDVYHRGEDIESQAFYYVAELESIIREWTARVYHRSKHEGLCLPETPGLELSPLEMYEIGLARAGGLTIPSSPDLAYEFLNVEWRTIQHYGIEVDGRRYDGAALNPYRNSKSNFGGPKARKWPIHIDSGDVRRVYFREPSSGKWSPLVWEHAGGLDQPFSSDAADYTKLLAVRENRHVDPQDAVRNLLDEWSKGNTKSKRDRALARRLASTRSTASDTGDGQPDDEIASLPGVIDLLARRAERRPPGWDLDDDLDVFEKYQGADDSSYEVFDE